VTLLRLIYIHIIIIVVWGGLCLLNITNHISLVNDTWWDLISILNRSLAVKSRLSYLTCFYRLHFGTVDHDEGVAAAGPTVFNLLAWGVIRWVSLHSHSTDGTFHSIEELGLAFEGGSGLLSTGLDLSRRCQWWCQGLLLASDSVHKRRHRSIFSPWKLIYRLYLFRAKIFNGLIVILATGFTLLL